MTQQPADDAAHPEDESDVVVDRPIGTRSFVYGAKVLVTAVVALLLTVGSGRDLWSAFWILVAAGIVGISFAFIERSTARGAERVSQRRVNVDVLLTVAVALVVNALVVVSER